MGAALLAFALGLAVLRYRLYDIDRWFTRTAVYVGLTSGVVAVFAVFAWVLGSQLNQDVLGSILAAVVIVLGIGPAREWLQRAVDRLMYGRRRDPYGALGGHRATARDHPQLRSGILVALTGAVTETLRLPYVAVTLAGQTQPAAATGRLQGASRRPAAGVRRA